MIGVMRKHWFLWAVLHTQLRLIVVSGVWKVDPLFVQKNYFDVAPVTIYRYFRDDPNSEKMLRLDW